MYTHSRGCSDAMRNPTPHPLDFRPGCAGVASLLTVTASGGMRPSRQALPRRHTLIEDLERGANSLHGLLHRTSVDSSLSKTSHQCSGARVHRGTIGVSSKTSRNTKAQEVEAVVGRAHPAIGNPSVLRGVVPGATADDTIHCAPRAIRKPAHSARGAGVQRSKMSPKREIRRSHELPERFLYIDQLLASLSPSKRWRPSWCLRGLRKGNRASLEL